MQESRLLIRLTGLYQGMSERRLGGPQPRLLGATPTSYMCSPSKLMTAVVTEDKAQCSQNTQGHLLADGSPRLRALASDAPKGTAGVSKAK